MVKATIFNGALSKEAHLISIPEALKRIKTGKSKEAITNLRSETDEEKQQNMKKTLPSVCFSGEFTKRSDDSLVKHSGLIVLDFDHVSDIAARKKFFTEQPYVYAVWISPRGNGLKVLVRIADPTKHRDHFKSLAHQFPDVDPSGCNPSRLCFESYDPEIYINEGCGQWTQTLVEKVTKISDKIVEHDEYEKFQKLLTWMAKNQRPFESGNRNTFVYVLASACCRFGITQGFAETALAGYSLRESTFSPDECIRTVRSAYRSNQSAFGTCAFEKNEFVNKVTKKFDEIEISDEEKKAQLRMGYQQVVDVREKIVSIYEQGRVGVKGVGIAELDMIFKMMRKELTVIAGYPNMGKSTLWRWYLLLRALLFDEKYAIFAPEDDPSEEFFMELLEICCGCNCDKNSSDRPNRMVIDRWLDFLDSHFFFVNTPDSSPTVKQAKEIFLELVVSKGVDGIVIDPFNQLAHDYRDFGGRDDKYLEFILADLSRFAKNNDIYLNVIAHPPKPPHGEEEKPPTIFQIAGGQMWANKSDNILTYHRPYKNDRDRSNECLVESGKIRKQKLVGQCGRVDFVYDRRSRRYLFGGIDYIQKAINNREKQTEIVFEEKIPHAMRPNGNFYQDKENSTNAFGQLKSDHPSDEYQDLF
jgi:replicative DNA helicase